MKTAVLTAGVYAEIHSRLVDDGEKVTSVIQVATRMDQQDGGPISFIEADAFVYLAQSIQSLNKYFTEGEFKWVTDDLVHYEDVENFPEMLHSVLNGFILDCKCRTSQRGAGLSYLCGAIDRKVSTTRAELKQFVLQMVNEVEGLEDTYFSHAERLTTFTLNPKPLRHGLGMMKKIKKLISTLDYLLDDSNELVDDEEENLVEGHGDVDADHAHGHLVEPMHEDEHAAHDSGSDDIPSDQS